ncbi:ribonuclease HII [Patescibacteria group bacterium]|nr:ribonuclease HII [Patescibacteria group bacterium]
MRYHPLEAQLKRDGIFFAGIDEAGRGPWAGPLVSAAVIMKPNVRIPGLNDSKQLTAKMREMLFGMVMKNSHVGLGIVTSKEIDRFGLAVAIKVSFSRAVEDLEIRPEFLLIDGIGKYDFGIPYKTVKFGDSKVKSIAAASIIAKVVRDTIMESYCKQYPKYGFSLHKGYGTRHHHEKLLQYGTCAIHRKSFAPIKKIIYGENC